MESTVANVKMLESDAAINIFNVVLGLPAAQALHVAYELNLFEIIGPYEALSLKDLLHSYTLKKDHYKHFYPCVLV